MHKDDPGIPFFIAPQKNDRVGLILTRFLPP